MRKGGRIKSPHFIVPNCSTPELSSPNLVFPPLPPELSPRPERRTELTTSTNPHGAQWRDLRGAHSSPLWPEWGSDQRLQQGIETKSIQGTRSLPGLPPEPIVGGRINCFGLKRGRPASGVPCIRRLASDPLRNPRRIPDAMTESLSRVRRLYLSLGRLLRVIERMYRLNLSVYDVNPVENVIHSFNGLHVEDGCNVISVDDVLL